MNPSLAVVREGDVSKRDRCRGFGDGRIVVVKVRGGPLMMEAPSLSSSLVFLVGFLFEWFAGFR